MRTYVYIDGFNLYYRALKGTPNKWLNVEALCQRLLPKAKIERINYYIARVTARPNDPDQPNRQNTYFRALRTIPNLHIVEGSFLTKPTSLPLESDTSKLVRVIRTEEKGSDVNLASHLIHDGHRGLYEQAVVISNDSDLVEPIRIVRDDLGLRVGLLYPSKYPNPQLQRVVTQHFTKAIRQGALSASQFPSVLTDSIGSFHKPKAW